MKMNILTIAIALLFAGCGGDDTPTPSGGNTPETPQTEVTTVRADLSLELTTDRALYRPGQAVTFTVEGEVPSGARVRYRNGFDIVGEQALNGSTWTWTPPKTDFAGYLADIYVPTADNAETVYATIGVDVSSDWGRYPRYGFVGTYDRSKTSDVIASEVAFLNRCHINGIQFYDWQMKHHWPLGGTPGNLLATYTDIANRTIVTDVVRDYISQLHQRGMKCMFYNLCYGAYKDGPEDGVSDDWGLYSQADGRTRDILSMPAGWKSDIYLMDPSNTSWQHYLAQRNDDVYAALDFDGFHIDQLGDRGERYNRSGQRVKLTEGFTSFINAMKAAHPDKSLVMNAVANFGSQNIVSTGNVDFMYSELWDGEAQYADLLSILKANRGYSGQRLNQVYAAYMNYNRKGSQFNTPGVLMADAVMFGIGASHLELGDHMLCHEYFPNNDLRMSEALRQSIVRYYDFLVAYEQLLRGTGITEAAADVTSSKSGLTINAWPPKLKGVTSYSTAIANRQVVHLFNFLQAKSLSWRDMDSEQPEPRLQTNIPLKLKATGVKRLWVATPDALAGAPQQLAFTQEGQYIAFTLPSLKYWTMIVVEK